MKQYTIIWITNNDYKIVGMKVFTNMEALRDFKNYYLKEYKHSELTQVDKEGYVWFVE